MIIHGSTLSPYCRKTVAFAHEKGVAVEVRPFRPGQPSDAVLRASPFGKMPALEDGDFAISDSSAIVAYLDALYPEPALIPAEPRARARTIWYDELADTIVMDAGRAIFGNRFVLPRVMKATPDHDAADRAEREQLPRVLDYLEMVVPDSGFLVEDRLTLADIAVVSPFATLGCIGVPIDAARYPRAHGYVAAILARPSFAESIVRDQGFVDAMGGPVVADAA